MMDRRKFVRIAGAGTVGVSTGGLGALFHLVPTQERGNDKSFVSL